MTYIHLPSPSVHFLKQNKNGNIRGIFYLNQIVNKVSLNTCTSDSDITEDFINIMTTQFTLNNHL